MDHKTTQFIIYGITEDGSRFRPNDWAERLCASVASFAGNGRIQRSPFVKIDLQGSEKRLIIDARLAETNAQGFTFLRNFANANRMRTETVTSATPSSV
jgi:hypothetical protein